MLCMGSGRMGRRIRPFNHQRRTQRMKPMGVTATLYIGKRRVGQMEWDKAIQIARLNLVMRSFTSSQRILALVAIGVHYVVTGKEIQ